MIRKILNTLFIFLLVFTTTNTVWAHYIDDNDEPVEVQIEEENNSEKRESEKEGKYNDSFDGLSFLASQSQFHIAAGIEKAQSLIYAFNKHSSPKKLYIEFHRLKVYC